MGVQDELDDLRAGFPGCSLVAFADLGAQIVLVSSSAETARRDTLDSLCRGAVSLFEAASAGHEPDMDTALRYQGGTVEVYVRDPDRSEDALCAQCSPDTDLTGFLAAARTAITALAGEGEG